MTVGIVVLGSFAHDYVQPYGTFLGQVVLTVLLLAFVGVLSWMRSLASYRPTPRFLVADPRSSVKLQPAGAAVLPEQAAPQPEVAVR